MIRRVLLTGGTGFIGSHVVEALCRRGRRVAVLKRKTSDLARLRGLPRSLLSFHDAGRPDLKDIFAREKPQAVLHVATYYRKAHVAADIEPMVTSNIVFPLRLLEAARDFGVRYFINTGTFFEILNRPLPVREDTAVLRPINLYALTKVLFEEALKAQAREFGLTAATLRIFTPYGPRDHEGKLIPTLIRKALRKETVSLSQGLQKLDFVYVKDIAQAYADILDAIERFPPGHETFNIASGAPISVREVVSLIEEILGRRVDVSWGSPAAADFDITFGDASKARARFGWAPRFDLARGLRETVAFHRRRSE